MSHLDVLTDATQKELEKQGFASRHIWIECMLNMHFNSTDTAQPLYLHASSFSAPQQKAAAKHKPALKWGQFWYLGLAFGEVHSFCCLHLTLSLLTFTSNHTQYQSYISFSSDSLRSPMSKLCLP